MHLPHKKELFTSQLWLFFTGSSWLKSWFISQNKNQKLEKELEELKFTLTDVSSGLVRFRQKF